MVRELNRRRFVASTAALTFTLTGCISGSDGGETPEDSGEEYESKSNRALVNVSRDQDYQVVPSRQVSDEDEVLISETDVETGGDDDDRKFSVNLDEASSDFRGRILDPAEKKLSESHWEFAASSGVLGTVQVVGGWVYFGSMDQHVYGLYDEDAAEIESPDPQVYSGYTQYGEHRDLDYEPPVSPELKWAFETDDKIGSTPAVLDSTLYIGSYDGSLYALDRFEGSLVWQHETGAAVNTSPAIHDDTVYFGADTGELLALDAEHGGEQWKFEAGGTIWSSPAVHDEVVTFGSYDHNVYGVDAETGEELWSHETADQVCAGSPSTVDGTVYIGSTDDNLYALDVRTGDEKWRFETEAGIVGSPHVWRDMVFVGSGHGTMYGLEKDTGREMWSFDTDDLLTSTPTVYDGVLYTASGSTIYEVEPATGEVSRRISAPAEIYSSPTIVGGVMYIGCTDGTVLSL